MTSIKKSDIMIKPSEMTAYNTQGWRNRQTRKLEVLVRVFLCGFKSHLLHHKGRVLKYSAFYVYIRRNKMILLIIFILGIDFVISLPVIIFFLIMYFKAKDKAEKTAYKIALTIVSVIAAIPVLAVIAYYIYFIYALATL